MVEALARLLMPQLAATARPGAGGAAAATSRATLPSPLSGLDAGARLVGMVIGKDAQGRPQISTARGDFVLSGVRNLIDGSRVTLEVRQSGAQPGVSLVSAQPPSGGNTAAAALTLANRWPALDQAVTTLHQNGHPPNGLPQPGPRLAIAVFAFMQAMRTGDLSTLLGRAAAQNLVQFGKAALGSSMATLGSEIQRDLGALERLASDQSQGPWRMLFVPLQNDNELHQLRFFVRNDDGPDDDQEKPENTRFVVEASTIGTGALQLDGLAGPKRLDLVMRTHTPLPESWKADIRVLFIDAAELVGVRGDILFQVMPDFPVSPIEETHAGLAAGHVA